jgi:beta-galactosidase
MLCPFAVLFSLLGLTARAQPVCDVTAAPWSARGDNFTDDSFALQAALSHAACSTVLLPAPGQFLSRALDLINASNKALIIAPGALLVAWRNRKTWGSTSALLFQSSNATALANFSVSGGGGIFGGGRNWWPPANQSDKHTWFRPHTLLLPLVANFSMADVAITDSPSCNIEVNGDAQHYKNIAIVAAGDECAQFAVAPNTGGFRVSGSNILVEDSTVHSGDDCVPVNPSPAGLTEHVLVRNVSCACGTNGPVIFNPGGVVRNVTFDNVRVRNTFQGAGVKIATNHGPGSTPIGGLVTDVVFSNIEITDPTNYAMYTNVWHEDVPGGVCAAPTPLPPGADDWLTAQNVSWVNVSARVPDGQGAGCFICAPNGGICRGWAFLNVSVQTHGGSSAAPYACVYFRNASEVGSSPRPCGVASGPGHLGVGPGAAVAPAAARSFTTAGNAFVKDGAPFVFRSAEIHYTRSHPTDWAARLRALVLAGFNTVTTYVHWNAHELQPGLFDFSTQNITAWLRAINDAGLLCILRVGPYVTAELDNGGFPFFLATTPGLVFRTNNSVYLGLVDRWWDALVPLLLPFQYSEGGPVVSLQIEDDTDTSINADVTRAYYEYLVQGLRRRGVTALLNTLGCFYAKNSVARAAVPGVWVALEFGVGEKDPATFCDDPAYRGPYPVGPCMLLETYTAWFDYVGGGHAAPKANFSAWVDAVLSNPEAGGVSVYMGFGGTNFGFSGGGDGRYNAITTSYDYQAPVTEAGAPGPLFAPLAEVFSRHGAPSPPPPPPPAPPVAAYGAAPAASCAPLFASLSAFPPPAVLPAPVPMEALGQAYGWTLYAATLPAPPAPGASLALDRLQDRALVFLDGAPQGGPLGWSEAKPQFSLPLQPPGTRLSVLVQNTGRCAGELIDSRCAIKGLLGGVKVGDAEVGGPWAHTALAFNSSLRALAAALPWQPGGACARGDGAPPAFWRATFAAPAAPAATYLNVTGWGHGFAWVNGFNLGRFSCRGPQGALYVPAGALVEGENTVVVFESDFSNKTGCKGVGGPAVGVRQVVFVDKQTWL